MNNIPKLWGGGEYNSSFFRLVNCSVKCHRSIKRRSLQTEGVAHSIDINRAQAMAPVAIDKPSETFCFYGITTI